MKPRILYIFFAALIILISISIWITKKSVKIQPVPEEKSESSQTATQVQNMLPDYATQPPITSEKKSAITIIKPASKEKPEPDLAQESEEIGVPAKPTTSPTGSSAASGKETEATIDGSGSDITKINKYPSEMESKEMNQRGIVMW